MHGQKDSIITCAHNGGPKVGLGAWAQPERARSDLEQAPPLASVPPLNSEGLGPAHLHHLHFPYLAPGKVHRHSSGQSLVCSVGSARRRLPPRTRGSVAAPLASSPWTRRPGPPLPITLSLKACWEGVLTDSGVVPTPEPDWPSPRCPQAAAQSSPFRAWPAKAAPLGLARPCTRLPGAPAAQ